MDEIASISKCAKERYAEIWSKHFEEARFSDCPKLISKVMTIIQHSKISCDKPLKENKTVAGIEAITATLEKPVNCTHPCVLIQGAPGIGKTVLMKEIAYRWSKKLSLQKFRLAIFLQLRDFVVHKMSELSHLLQSFVQSDTKVVKTPSACLNKIFKNGGKDVVFLFDGFDELPETLRKDGLIVDIIQQRVLPCCTVMVSSRPSASEILHRQVTTKIDILGFTTDGVKSYIETAMEDQPQAINDLTQYVINQPIINTLCFVPFNVAILVDMYKNDKLLPRNATELYKYFICLTICRHLAKHREKCNIAELTDLPEPYNGIIQELSKLAYDAFESSKCVFTLDEVKAASPSIKGLDDTLGLLQAQHVGKSTTYNFLHFTIQEFLAASYLSTCSSNELELTVLKEKFWKNTYSNIFIFYMGLTKGQRPSFLRFLSYTEFEVYNNDQLKFLRLYRCFHEADCTEICHALKQSQPFATQTIDLSHIALSADEVMCTTFCLLSSNIKWREVNLCNCYIQDHGVHILYQGLCTIKKVQITTLQLARNHLTEASASVINNIVMKCDVHKLWINNNHFVGESLMLYSMLSDCSTVLEHLFMVDTKLSSKAAATIFMALKHNKTLKELVITDNNITDDVCNTMTRALQSNRTLVKLWMWNNPMCTETLLSILRDLQANDTLALLGLPNCSEKSKAIITSLQQSIIKKRKNRGCHVTLVIDFM